MSMTTILDIRVRLVIDPAKPADIILLVDPPVRSVDHAQILASHFLAMAARNCNEGWDAAIDAVLREAMKVRGLKP